VNRKNLHALMLVSSAALLTFMTQQELMADPTSCLPPYQLCLNGCSWWNIFCAYGCETLYNACLCVEGFIWMC
jgi:hypothetical protein